LIRAKGTGGQAGSVDEIWLSGFIPRKPNGHRIRNFFAGNDHLIIDNFRLSFDKPAVRSGDGELVRRHAIASAQTAKRVV
jgi:hypothetical protein